MFGLSTKELLVKQIKNACIDKKQIYKEITKYCFQRYSNITEDNCSPELKRKIDIEAAAARKAYKNEVFAAMVNSIQLNKVNARQLFDFCIMSPEICGLKDLYSIDVFDEQGVSAGAVFAMCYYVLTNKAIGDRDYKTIQMLNHYQADVMREAIAEADSELG